MLKEVDLTTIQVIDYNANQVDEIKELVHIEEIKIFNCWRVYVHFLLLIVMLPKNKGRDPDSSKE